MLTSQAKLPKDDVSEEERARMNEVEECKNMAWKVLNPFWK